VPETKNRDMENSCKVTQKPKNVKEFFTTWYFWKPFIGVVAGLLAGFLYFHFVECTECSWSITRDTYSSMFFGGFLGFFVTGSPCARFGR
jgi:hypothetical protein